MRLVLAHNKVAVRSLKEYSQAFSYGSTGTSLYISLNLSAPCDIIKAGMIESENTWK